MGEAENGKELIELVVRTDPNVIFVDADMPVLSGIEAAKEIFDIDPKIFIIFATAYACYTRDAFDVYAFDYLLKPIDVQRLKKTLNRIKMLKREMKQAQRDFHLVDENKMTLGIQSMSQLSFVNPEEIIFISRYGRKTVIHTLWGIIESYEPMQTFEEKLSKGQFFRCHKGYIVNVKMVLDFTPWGDKTYLVRLAHTEETALTTLEKAKEFRMRYSL